MSADEWDVLLPRMYLIDNVVRIKDGIAVINGREYKMQFDATPIFEKGDHSDD